MNLVSSSSPRRSLDSATELDASTSLDSESSSKRPLPNTLDDYDNGSQHVRKRARTTVASTRWPSDDALNIERGRDILAQVSRDAYPRHRSSSPSQLSFAQTAAHMLSRAEETGGNRTVRMARGPGSASPARLSSSHTMRLSGDQTPRARTISNPKTWSAETILDSAGLVEFLSQDDQPIFVVDLHDEGNLSGHEMHLVFANEALESKTVLYDGVRGLSDDASYSTILGTPFADFRSWALSQLTESETVRTFPFAGILWKSTTVQKRLKIITGNANSIPLPVQEFSTPSFMQPQNGYFSSKGSPGYFDHASPRVRPKLVTTSVSGSDVNGPRSPRTPIDATPTPSGDIGHSDLLSGSLSPSAEQRTLPSTTQPEIIDVPLPKVPGQGSFDWTRLPLSPNLPSHIQFARAVNWGDTSLGPIENWKPDLRGMCNLIMASPHPSAMYWGPDHIAIYNEPYVLLAGQKHPALMGSRYRDAWVEIWHALEEVFDNAYRNAQATMKDDDCLFIVRNGFLEETYFSWSIIPLIGSDGSVAGLYNPAFEKTRRKVAERRMLTLREIGEKTASARQVGQFWSLLLQGLQFNELDAPMVMVYSLNSDFMDGDTSSSASSSGAANKVARLEGSLGVPSGGHPAAPPTIDLKTSQSGFAWVFRQALTTDRPIVLSVDDGTLDPAMLEDIEWRGYGDPSRILVVCPIHPTTGESTLGFLVMGTNPRRPYDEDYELFIQLLARQLATSVASVVLFEAEIKKGEEAAKLAAQDRIELNNQLVARTQEAVEAENKFTRMAELAPVGMFIGDAAGALVLVNDAWYDLTSFPRDLDVGNSWIDFVYDEDRDYVWNTWQTMLAQKCPISIEFRFNTPRNDKMGNETQTWVLASASPEKNEDGNLKRVFGSMTDISAQKFAEKIQTRRMEDALELKRQQEKYIDTTSHEMRNPLSAILQSADSITSSLTEMQEEDGLTKTQKELLELTMDSAQTITLCAQHQKRIVDDVLTLSKLDSAMVVVTPVDAQPVKVIQRSLKMFEGELSTADIALEFKVESSYASMGIDWVRIDPHRLSQVLINLTTNAIKFTTTQEKRTINMYVGASREKPSIEDKWGLTYIPSRLSKDRDVTAAAEWGLGETIYLHFAVEDTGRGLDTAEKKQLFQRFSQANPRTHISYGGSGLGLFISRELVELQGGEIGVASETGKGSTFAFYIKARRSQRPQVPPEGEIGPVSAGVQFRKGSRASKNHHLRLLSEEANSGAGGARKQSATLHKPPSLSSIPTSPITPAPSDGLNVLVVEDNLINQKVLATQLRKIGCVVHVANHGQEAIEQIMLSQFWVRDFDSSSAPGAGAGAGAQNTGDDDTASGSQLTIDVVLMDLEMPVMDGQTCARKLREYQLEGRIRKHIPVIAVTANAREEQILMARQSGIDDVVSKPFRIVELVPRMRDVVGKFPGR
jgi:PAS domain S-box-containing protein